MGESIVTTDYQQLIREHILNEEDFIKATFSGKHQDKTVPWLRVVVRPVLVRGQRHLQFSYFDAKKDITKNYRGDESAEKLEELLVLGFRNVHIQTAKREIAITLSSKGKPLIRSTRPAHQLAEVNLSHDRQKNVLLTAGDAAPFLKEAGIMTREGKIRADMQGKFRQINEFLRLVQQTGALEKFDHAPLHVVDCGCGNAYLTFAFYYYLQNVLHIPTQMTGIDVNGELLAKLAQKSASAGWADVAFQTTRIIDFQPAVPPEIVLALHACDTATDEALAQGIRWQSKLIVSVPCCQHHLQEQLDHRPAPSVFRPVERHGILKERLGDILTDAFRALILRIMGYRTDVVEFVSSEHTDKNLMIRAVKSLKAGDPQFVREYKELKDFWKVTPYLEQLLGEDFTRPLQ
jgi:SAM-dependent methyltransferase